MRPSRERNRCIDKHYLFQFFILKRVCIIIIMENPEEILQALDEFVKLKPKDIPKELEEYLMHVAKTGDSVFNWSIVKYLFREKLLNVITDFYEGAPTIELPPCPNVDTFNYEIMKNSLLERLESFASAPFTVQRLCELLTSPKKQYSRADKFMRAVEKNILVVSTREPGHVRRTDSSQSELVNGVSDGPTVELGEAVETVTSDGVNLMHVSSGSVRLTLDDTATGSTTRIPTADPKCSHSADTVDGLDNHVIETPQKVVTWLNDPSLTDPNRLSVSERVALIERGSEGDNLDVGSELTGEFHPSYVQPITNSGLMEEEEDEDYIPSSQEGDQYFPNKKPKPTEVDSLGEAIIFEGNPPSPETSAAVSAITIEQIGPTEPATLSVMDVPPEIALLSTDTNQDILNPEVGIENTNVEPTLETKEEQTLENATTPVSADITTKLIDTTSIESAVNASGLEAALLDERIHDILEPSNTNIEELHLPLPLVASVSAIEPIKPLESVVLEPSVSVPEEIIPPAEPIISETPEPIVADSAVAVPPLAEVKVAEELLEKLPTEKERDREMMVQNERIESVIQENVEQVPVTDIQRDDIVPEIVASEPIVTAELPLVVADLIAETPMEAKMTEVEPEAMDVDEASQPGDEPMDQGDTSPKES